MSNILETTLAMLGIEKYSKQFRCHGVDRSVLSLLSDKDLQIIGIEDEELRNRILKQFSTLPIPDDFDLDLEVDNEYMYKVLNNMNQHLLLLNASLAYAYHTKNVQVTEVQLSNPTKCLLGCIESIEQQANSLYEKFSPTAEKSDNKFKYIALALFLGTTAVFAIKRCMK